MEMTEPCVFCRMVTRQSRGNVVQEWNDALAIVPLTPVTRGHVLIIPKRHVADALEMPFLTGRMMVLASQYAVKQGHESCNILTSVGAAATQSIRHLHLHVVPRAVDDQLMLPWGTIYGDEPSAPHWCRVARELENRLISEGHIDPEDRHP